jgi:hypothetical protein
MMLVDVRVFKLIALNVFFFFAGTNYIRVK